MAEQKTAQKPATSQNGDQKPQRRVLKRTPIDPNESPAAKFKRLANFRVPKAVKIIRYIGGLANRNIYEYTDEQRDLLISTLQSELDSMKSRFDQKKEAETVKPIF